MEILQKLKRAIRMIGWANIFRAIRYTFQKNRLDQRYLQVQADAAPRRPGRLMSAEALPGGARFQFENTNLEVSFLLPDLVFLGWDGSRMLPSYAVIETDWPVIPVTLQQTDQPDRWRVSSTMLDVLVEGDGSLSVLDSTRRLIWQEGPPEWSGESWGRRAELEPETAVYGLGERAGHLNLRPGSYRFWNRDADGAYGPGADPLYINMPVYLCLHGNGSSLVFYDNTFYGQLDLGESANIRFNGGPVRQYLAVGSPAVLLERLTTLTGRAPLPARWAFGYQQSRWGYHDETEMRLIYAEFKRRNLPISALVADIDLQDGFRTLTVDSKRFPNLADFSRMLLADGVHLVAILDPGVKIDPQFDLYREGLELGAFCTSADGNLIQGVVWPGWSAFPDFTNPRVREWWGRQYRRLLENGVNGFWHDMNEPASFTVSGDMSLPLSTRHDLDGAGGDHREAHNVYGLNMIRAGYDGLRRLDPDHRPFILSRSGWVGMQRYSWTWTGDIATSWDVLRQTIPCVLGLSLCGVPYSGPDIGGFSGKPTPELFIRWFQLGSFLPFFRTHSNIGFPEREPWVFGEAVEECLRKALELRYQLLPFWYTLAWQNSQTGQPIVRPLFWDNPGSEKLRSVEDAFLLGSSLLVAPVVEENARQRSVYLPEGKWYELGKDICLDGDRAVVIDAPLDRIPVFARAGSLLPVEQEGEIILHLYCPVEGSIGRGEFYTDAGDGFGPGCLNRYELIPTEDGGYRLTWQKEGDFLWPYQGLGLQFFGFNHPSLILNGQTYDVTDHLIRLEKFEGDVLIYHRDLVE